MDEHILGLGEVGVGIQGVKAFKGLRGIQGVKRYDILPVFGSSAHVSFSCPPQP